MRQPERHETSPASLKSAVWANPVDPPTMTRIPAPRSRPLVSSSTRPSSSKAEEDRLSSTNISANSPPVPKAAESVLLMSSWSSTPTPWSRSRYGTRDGASNWVVGTGRTGGWQRRSGSCHRVGSCRRSWHPTRDRASANKPPSPPPMVILVTVRPRLARGSRSTTRGHPAWGHRSRRMLSSVKLMDAGWCLR